MIYSSDNGPWLSKKHHGGSAKPLRAGKGTTYEGGMRVPGIVRWPGHVPAGTVTDEVASTIDLLPTLSEITGAALPDHPIDGASILATWKDPSAPSPHRDSGFFYYRNNRVEALRLGKWKLRTGQTRRPRGRRAAPVAGKVELYDLDADIGETTNLAEKHPEVVERLQGLARKYDADLKASSRPLWRAAKKGKGGTSR